MAPTFKHGKNAFFSVTSATGGTINLSSGLDDISFPRTADSAETTVFGLGDRRNIAGIRDASVSVSGHFSSTHDAKLPAMLGHSTTLNYIYGPAGNSTGLRKYTGGCILTSYEISSPVGDKVSMKLEFQGSGAVTATAF